MSYEDPLAEAIEYRMYNGAGERDGVEIIRVPVTGSSITIPNVTTWSIEARTVSDARVSAWTVRNNL